GNTTWQQHFIGTGMAIVGRVEHKLPDAEAKTKSMEVELWIDGKLYQTVLLPAWSIQRRFDPFFVFELPDGKHDLMLKVKKDDGLRFVASHFVSYGAKAYNFTNDLNR
ncbi:MAG: hypothetical protein MUF24_12805, partial [Chitinophagaceae bacterium]|nr:hypothetical protein [Chitinophagaceae bacterium]